MGIKKVLYIALKSIKILLLFIEQFNIKIVKF